VVGVMGFFALTGTANCCFNKDLKLLITDWNGSKNGIESNDLPDFVQFFMISNGLEARSTINQISCGY